MKIKLTMLGIAAAAGLTLFGGAAGSALAAGAPAGPSQPAVAVAPDDQPDFAFPYEWPFPWVRHSIIEAAATTIGIEPWRVRDRLRDGLSLDEIADNHGIGEERLENGILREEWDDLQHQVHDGRITWQQAGDYYAQLSLHIDQIVRYHRNDAFVPLV